jgi:putative pyruvate formate lyase activating enzyme
MDERLEFFRSQFECCMLCPRECGVARNRGELGFCKAGPGLKVSSFCLHTGEEPPVSTGGGSGTIFFTHCSMACVYCQNFPISQLGYGNPTGMEDLVRMMLSLQQRGAANINLVTPTHFLPPIVEAILAARQRGLMLPIVYNTGGYEKAETMAMLEGIVQIYLVDMRYFGDDTAIKYSSAPGYHHNNTRAILEMVRQVGPLNCANETAQQGVIIRHLLLPSLTEETRRVLAFVATNLPPATPISLMSQYFPAHRAHDFPELSRKITRQEYDLAVVLLEEYCLTAGWVQEFGAESLPVA